MKKTVVVVSLTTLLISGIASAAGYEAATPTAKPASKSEVTSTMYHAQFVKLDANKDGYVEKTEAQSNANLGADFDKFATGGRLSETEFAAWESQHQAMHKPAIK